VRRPSVWARLVGAQGAVVEGVDLDKHPGGGGVVLVVSVRVSRRGRSRCGVCQRRCPGYDRGAGRRRWRALDLGTVPAVIEAEAPRVTCPATAWSWPRCPGPGIRPGTPATSMTRSRGWRWRRASPRSASCYGSPGAPWERSSPGSKPTSPRALIGWPGYAGSASMRSATRRATSTSPSWSTTTPDAWSGPRPAGTRRPCTPSSTPSAPGVPGS
jgi:zinc-finger of transposase IS204/IS1001/IS1096/IS1165